MRLENLISELAAHDTVSVAGGEVQFGKCLKEVIGGVPIYDIWALRTGECAERVVFANVEEIDDFLLESDSSFRICSQCQEFAGDMGYYMGDLDYVSNMMLKIATYEQNNIFTGNRLICTFESVRRPLSVSVLRNKLSILI